MQRQRKHSAGTLQHQSLHTALVGPAREHHQPSGLPAHPCCPRDYIEWVDDERMFVSTKMDYVDHGRYGNHKAPSNMVKAIRITTDRLMDVFENEHGINSMVISGIHEHAILAYYISTCMQTLQACKHWQTCSYPGILCVCQEKKALPVKRELWRHRGSFSSGRIINNMVAPSRVESSRCWPPATFAHLASCSKAPSPRFL